MTTQPDRTRAAILATGAVTEQRISRRLAATICRDCHARTVRALDGDVCAFDVACDPDPIDHIGELIAVATARTTYDLARTRHGLELEPRRAYHLTRPRAYPVLAEHRCHQPLAAPTAPASDGKDAPDAPPY